MTLDELIHTMEPNQWQETHNDRELISTIETWIYSAGGWPVFKLEFNPDQSKFRKVELEIKGEKRKWQK